MIILIGISQPVVRKGLDALLRQVWPDLELETVDTFLQVQEQLSKDPVDLLVVGLALPDLSGPADLGWLRETHPDLKILALSDRDNRTVVLECLAAGVNGCASMALSIEQLQRAFVLVASGQIYVSPILAQARSRDGPASSILMQTNHDPQLTPRQADMLRLLHEGSSNKGIARKLGLGLGTVKTHLGALYSAFGSHSRLEVIAKSSAAKYQQPPAARNNFMHVGPPGRAVASLTPPALRLC